jgi:hypothetical protein
MSLVIVFTATSEFQALTVRDLLQQNDVPAIGRWLLWHAR